MEQLIFKNFISSINIQSMGINFEYQLNLTIVFGIYKLSKLGVSSNLIGSLSRAIDSQFLGS